MQMLLMAFFWGAKIICSTFAKVFGAKFLQDNSCQNSSTLAILEHFEDYLKDKRNLKEEVTTTPFGVATAKWVQNSLGSAAKLFVGWLGDVKSLGLTNPALAGVIGNSSERK